MTSDIKVRVTEFAKRRYFQLQWKDPVTGLKKTRSSGIERTSLKAARTQAERVAAKLEADLRENRLRQTTKMTWGDFRDRHEDEVQVVLSRSSQQNFSLAFDLVEQLMAPVLVREVTTERISRWVAQLKAKGLADTTIGLHLREVRAAMNWAHSMEFIPAAPKVKIPKGAREAKPRGRPITGEEHDRMLAATPHVIRAPCVAVWREFLTGLWWSGLRLREAVALSWDTREPVAAVMQTGYRPALHFEAAGQKGRRTELVPAAPEFAEMLGAVPECDRTGRVFKIPVSPSRAGQLIGEIGRTAGVITNPSTGKVASAQDYRRSFGDRWSRRVMPPTLKRLMRHKKIETTLQYYVGQEVEDIAEVVWEAYERTALRGNTIGNTGAETPCF